MSFSGLSFTNVYLHLSRFFVEICKNQSPNRKFNFKFNMHPIDTQDVYFLEFEQTDRIFTLQVTEAIYKNTSD